MLKYFDSIIFDLDGTLFQTDKLVIPAFNNTFKKLQSDGYRIDKIPNNQEILSVIGLTLDEIWEKLLNNLKKDIHYKASEYLLMYEIEGIREGYGNLYSGVIETLIKLKNNDYKLYVASNGLKNYVYEVTKSFNINHLFDDIYSAEDFNTNSKSKLVRKIITIHNINKGVIVGDRLSDVEAGKNNNLYVIGCDFGFSSKNELNNSDIIINEFTQIIDILENKIVGKR